MSVAKGLSVLFVLSKNYLLVSFIFFFLVSLIHFYSDLYDFFPSTNILVLVCLFYSSFKYKIKLFV